MRGHPLLQIGVLSLAMALMGALVALVVNLGPTSPPLAVNAIENLTPDTVPALLTVSLSAPAASLSLTEPSGRIITISTREGLEIEQEVNLTVNDSCWSALLSVTWQEPGARRFLRLDFEPELLKSSHLLLDVYGDTENYPVTANFDTDSP